MCTVLIWFIIGERQEAQILNFNAPPYTLSLWCPSYNKFSQLSYEPGCSRELWCRKCATWLWNKYVLIFSKTLFYTHIQRHTDASGTKCYQNNVNDTFLESRNVKDYENVKLVNLSSCPAAQLPLILCMISKNSDFGVGGNVKFFTEANFILMNTKFSQWEMLFGAGLMVYSEV